MKYQIQIEQRLDRQKLVIDAIKELTNDFVILTGMVYSGNQHRTCWLVEINSDKEIDFKPLADKLMKATNMSAILVTQHPLTIQSITQQSKGDSDAPNQ